MLSLSLAIATALLFVPWPVTYRLGHARVGDDRERLLAAIAAELRAGSSLRLALAAATEGHAELRSVGRMARSGAPLPQVIDALGADTRLRSAVLVAAESGGRSSRVFQRLADRAAADNDEARQRRVLTAQARMSAAVVAGIPVVWLVFGGLARIQTLVDGGAAAVAGLGLAMEAAGVGLVWRLAPR